MKKKIILAIAPQGGWGKGDYNPLTPEEISEEVVKCSQIGASLVHLHARDKYGQLTADINNFSRTTELIRQKSTIIIEASTGGLSQLTAEERALPLQDKNIEIGSLNMGSLNFLDQVYINRVPDINFWFQKMNQFQIKPCMEIFDTANIRISYLAIKEGWVKPDYLFNFIFDYHWGMSFSLSLLKVLIEMLPQDSKWGVIFGNNNDFKNHLKSIIMGASMVRVGFEDSPVANNKWANSNLQIVEQIKKEIEILGYSLATPEETRDILNLA